MADAQNRLFSINAAADALGKDFHNLDGWRGTAPLKRAAPTDLGNAKYFLSV